MNLTLTLFLAQSSGLFKSIKWAADIATEVCGNYFQGGGDIFACHVPPEERDRHLMEEVMRSQHRGRSGLTYLLDCPRGGDAPDFVKPSGVILFVRHGEVTYPSSVQSFLTSIMKSLHLEMRVVVIVERGEYLSEEDVRTVLEMFWKVNVGNVIVLNVAGGAGGTGVNIFFWRPDARGDGTSGIAAESIRKISVPVLGEGAYVDSLAKSSGMYSAVKSEDVKGNFLRVSVSVAPPYVWRKEEPQDGADVKEYVDLTTDKLGGIEISILETFRRKYDLSGFFIVHPSELIDLHHFEKTFHNYSLLEEAAFGMSDVAVGGNLPHSDLYSFFSPTAPYLEDSMYWYVPSAKEVQRWKILFMIFDKYVWSFIAIAHLLTAVTGFALSGNRNSQTGFSGAMLSVWATVLNQPPPLKITGRLRLLFAPALLYGMHISIFYQSSLVGFLGGRRREAPIASLREAREHNMKLCLSGISYDFFQKEDLSRENMSVVVHPDYTECLDEVANNRNHLALMPEKTTEYTIPFRYLDESLSRTIRKMPEKLVSYPVSMYLTKASPFKKRLDFVIQGLLEGGIIDKWWDEVRLFERAKTASAGEYRSISLGRASGVFSVFLLGASVSAAVFVVEVMWNEVRAWKQKLK